MLKIVDNDYLESSFALRNKLKLMEIWTFHQSLYLMYAIICTVLYSPY